MKQYSIEFEFRMYRKILKFSFSEMATKMRTIVQTFVVFSEELNFIEWTGYFSFLKRPKHCLLKNLILTLLISNTYLVHGTFCKISTCQNIVNPHYWLQFIAHWGKDRVHTTWHGQTILHVPN